jgi:hypothetical protein
MSRFFMVDWSNEEIIELDGSEHGTKTVFKPVHTNDHGPPVIACKLCGELLGEISDENIEHQCEYHSCPIGG